ncbi:MAG: MFS transporter [Candidatus Absconditabacteria bacterium]|nr:MFS transporter [Candidatus Absconditabacteria bacterium]
MNKENKTVEEKKTFSVEKIQNIFASIKSKIKKTKENIVKRKDNFFTKTKIFFVNAKEKFVAKKNKIFRKKDVERAKEDIKESLIEAKDIVKENLIEAKETTQEQIETIKEKTEDVAKDINKKLVIVKDKLFQSKDQEINNGLISIVKKKLGSIPFSIRAISFSLFLFIFGWGLGAEVYFSIYIKEVINNVFWISLIGAILPLSRLLFALPIGELNDNTDRKAVIFLSKIMYIICGILFFLAGILRNHQILLIAVVFNGIASATLYITYESYIRTTTDKHHSENSRGLYFSSMNAALVVGAVIGAFLVKWISLPYLYLFIVLFTILSLFSDKKIPIIKKKQIKEILGKDSFLLDFIKRVFSLKPFIRTFIVLKSESRSFMYSLGFEGLFNILSYVGFLFIPLVAVENNLGLPQVAFLFALMRLPYLTNFFTATWSERFDKKLFVAVVLLFLSFLYAFLAFEHSFLGIMIVSFGISLGLSIIRPAISALITEHSTKNNSGSITGVQTFVGGVGSIAGSIGFGIISTIFGMQMAFLVVGLGVFVLAIWGITKKMKYRMKILRTRKIVNSM